MMTHVKEITTQPVELYCVLFAWSANWMRCVNMREGGKERETAVSSFCSSSRWFKTYLENGLPSANIIEKQSRLWWLIYRFGKKKKFVKKDHEYTVEQNSIWQTPILKLSHLKDERECNVHYFNCLPTSSCIYGQYDQFSLSI